MRAPAVERCEKCLGRFCFVPVGKCDPKLLSTTADLTEGLKGLIAAGTQGPVPLPEVRFLSEEGGGDFCLAYGAASALHYFGDSKLSPLLIDVARRLEQIERQMEAMREAARASGWQPERIVGQDALTFEPLKCAPESVYVLHLRELDGASDHAIAIARGMIFDANRALALPLSPAGLAAIGYAGIVSATRLTPPEKVAKAIAKKRANGGVAP